MEQADSRFMLYRRPITKNYHLSSPYLYYIGLHACPLPHCSLMECSDSAAYQSRLVWFDGSWSFVRSHAFFLLGLLSTFLTDRVRFFTDRVRSNSTAACCIVRTVLNWQNVNSDPTWDSVFNWYWRAWEVCIGIVAACIPALRPGYRTVSASISSYLSHRSLRKGSDFALVDSHHPSHPPANREANTQHIAAPRASYDPALGAAAQAISTEADRAQKCGADVDGFAMKPLPGDIKPTDQGIKKIKTFAGTSADGSQRSLELGDLERGFGNRDFL